MARPTPYPGKRKQRGDDDSSSSGEGPDDEPIRDGRSAREQARAHLLAVAHLPLDALDTKWSTGTNRPLNAKHVRRLQGRFRTGLERCTPENRILGLCSAADVRRLKTRSQLITQEEGRAEEVYDFADWLAVNDDKVEVLAGQHRMAALRQLGAPAEDQWWSCELYDRDTLPTGLDVQLRVNRTDTTLPDSHGQIWNQLVSIASPAAGGKAGRRRRPQEKEVVEALRLGGEQFPTRRVLTLYYNERWRDMITRWCATRLGQETFNISTCEWMCRLRVDEYWFEVMEAVLAALRRLPVDERTNIGHADWARLVKASRARGPGDAAFYRHRDRGQRVRIAGLLEDLTDGEYDAVARHVGDGTALPGLERLTGVKKTQGQATVRVLHQVLAWFDPAGAAASERGGKVEKSLVSQRLRTAIEAHWARPGENADASDEAVTLQAKVLEHAATHLKSFLASTPSLPEETSTAIAQPDYGRRFAHAEWASLLAMAREVAAHHGGNVLRPDWATEAATDEGRGGQGGVGHTVQGLCREHVVRPRGVSVVTYDAATRALQRKILELIREANEMLERAEGAEDEEASRARRSDDTEAGSKRRRLLTNQPGRALDETIPGKGINIETRKRTGPGQRRPLPMTDDESAEDDAPAAAQAGSVARRGAAAEEETPAKARGGDHRTGNEGTGAVASHRKRTRPVFVSSSPAPEEASPAADVGDATTQPGTPAIVSSRGGGIPGWLQGPQSRPGAKRGGASSRRS